MRATANITRTALASTLQRKRDGPLRVEGLAGRCAPCCRRCETQSSHNKRLHSFAPQAPKASQRSLQDAPIFRLLLKVAVKGTHQCDFTNFWGSPGLPTTSAPLWPQQPRKAWPRLAEALLTDARGRVARAALRNEENTYDIGRPRVPRGRR